MLVPLIYILCPFLGYGATIGLSTMKREQRKKWTFLGYVKNLLNTMPFFNIIWKKKLTLSATGIMPRWSILLITYVIIWTFVLKWYSVVTRCIQSFSNFTSRKWKITRNIIGNFLLTIGNFPVKVGKYVFQICLENYRF